MHDRSSNKVAYRPPPPPKKKERLFELNKNFTFRMTAFPDYQSSLMNRVPWR